MTASRGQLFQRSSAAAGGVLAAVVVGAVGLALTPQSPAAPAPVSAAPVNAAPVSPVPVSPVPVSPVPVSPVPDVAATRSSSEAEARPVPRVSEAPRPVAVALPALSVRSALDPLRLQPDGKLQAPPRWDVAGWYADGPRPGRPGPAVIAGHVDGPDGPAVFWRLQELRRGDRVEVTRADGSVAVFAVTRTLSAAKDDFPTADVYGPTPHPELRLITCDGGFDRSSGHYLDNLVVFATQVDA